jgi:iron complex outermembrane receptor protein
LNLALPVSAGWRMVPAGNRTNESNSKGSRIVADLSGVLAGFDYKAGAFYTRSTAADAAVDGYVNAPFVRAQVGLGNLNPFADATPAQLAVIEQAKRKGTFAQATGETRGFDARISREIFDLPGGKAAFALGAEYRKESYRNDTNDDVVLGIPSAGRSPNHVGGTRDVKALGGELLLPVFKQLEIQLALRTDDYSDAGRSTNPKIGVRYQPIKEVAIRGSYNHGFRAPTLDDLYGPQTVTFTAGALNDPLLCDANGKAIPAAGGVQGRDCGQQPQVQQGGNPGLKPEKSKTFSFGFALEPMKELTLTVDYWNIKLKDQLGSLPPLTIVSDPVRYAANIVRCKTLSAAAQTELSRCSGLDANSNAIGYLVTLTDNIGQVKTDGIDVGLAYGTKLGNLGTVNLTYDGTWVHSYTYQTNPSDPFKQNVGLYSDGSPVFRWKHAIGVGWGLGDWGSRLNIRHQTGYRDQNDATTVVGGPSFYGNVKPYTLVDLSGTYKFSKATAVTLGVKNLFDTDPPFSNQSTRSQRGYDPRYTDATGRAYFVRAAYGF